MVNMKTLFPKQRESVDFLKSALTKYGGALDSSHTGVGKTVISAHLAMEMGMPVVIVCPKIVIPNWIRELAEVGVVPIIVTNYEKLKQGSPVLAMRSFVRGKKIIKTFSWALPEKSLIIWDECHKCKAAFSQNSKMLIAAKQAGHYNLLLSATACQDPTEMRSIGFILGLHALERPDTTKKGWVSWMMGFGCKRDPWNKWVAGPVAKLKPLADILYSTNCTRLTHKDLPDAFTENHVITEPLAFASLSSIAKYYKEHGITPEIVERYLEDGAASPHVLVEMLRARQLAEAAKVPDILDMVADACAEGYSVAVFVNFTDTIKALADAIPNASVIVGGQSDVVREGNVSRFQTNQTNVILCNTAAGGVGVSLHDTVGGHPRMTLISPTFNVKDYIQVLGRVHRAGAKSPAVQRILVASKTIEEKIIDIMEKKRISLATLHPQRETK